MKIASATLRSRSLAAIGSLYSDMRIDRYETARACLAAALIAFISVLRPPPLHAQGMRAPEADALVVRWIEASGGPGVWDAVKRVQYTITTVWYNADGSEQRRRPRFVWIRKFNGGYRVRVERTEAEGKYVQAWDGLRGWATLNGQLLADTARAAREVEYVAGDLHYWVGLPWKLHDPGVRLTFLESEPNAPGRVVHVTFGANVGDHDQDRFWYYFDEAGSPMPREVHYIEGGRPDTSRERVRFDRWGQLGRARFLEHRTIVDANGRPLRSLIVSDLEVNGTIPDALFRAPASPRR